MAFQIQVKSETPFDIEKERECFIKDLVKPIKSEPVTCNNNCEVDTPTEIEEHTLVSYCGSQNEREFLPEVPVTNIKRENSDDEVIEITEPCWLKTETSTVSDDIQEVFCSVKSPRLCGEVGPHTADNLHVNSFIQVSVLENISLFVYEAKSSTYQIREKSFPWPHDTVHEGKRPPKCNICERSFTGLAGLKRHNVIHGNNRPFKCNICERSFTGLAGLKRHNLIHENNRPFKCNVCGKSFTGLAYLKVHILLHEGKRLHKCNICGRSFTRLDYLRKHNIIHDGKRPHKCSICGTSFTRADHLKKHSVTHENKRPYKCSICEKRFTTLDNLKRHNLIHEDGRPHKCNICGMGFLRLYQLRKHTLLHDSIIPISAVL